LVQLKTLSSPILGSAYNEELLSIMDYHTLLETLVL